MQLPPLLLLLLLALAAAHPHLTPACPAPTPPYSTLVHGTFPLIQTTS